MVFYWNLLYSPIFKDIRNEMTNKIHTECPEGSFEHICWDEQQHQGSQVNKVAPGNGVCISNLYHWVRTMLYGKLELLHCQIKINGFWP